MLRTVLYILIPIGNLKVKNDRNYEKFIQREIENIDFPLAVGIKNEEISYYEILNDENNYTNNVKIFDFDNNWLAIDVHNKDFILDNEMIMKVILSEMKRIMQV